MVRFRLVVLALLACGVAALATGCASAGRTGAGTDLRRSGATTRMSSADLPAKVFVIQEIGSGVFEVNGSGYTEAEVLAFLDRQSDTVLGHGILLETISKVSRHIDIALAEFCVRRNFDFYLKFGSGRQLRRRSSGASDAMTIVLAVGGPMLPMNLA